MLGIKALSREIIEAVYSYSDKSLIPLILELPTESIGGYLMSSQDFYSSLKDLRSKYSNSQVYLSRIDCGPPHNEDLTSTYKILEIDSRNNIDIVQLDFSELRLTRDKLSQKYTQAIKYAQRLNPGVTFQLGSCDTQPGTIQGEIEFFRSFAHPVFFTFDTGAKILEARQAGAFKYEASRRAAMIIKEFNIKTRETNLDFSTPEQIQLRKNIIDYISIGPELALGVNNIMIENAEYYNISLTNLTKEAMSDKSWIDQIDLGSPDDGNLCLLLRLHTLCHSKEYQRLVKRLEEKINLQEITQKYIFATINKYVQNFL